MRVVLITIIFLGWAGCRWAGSGHLPKIGFYYWRTSFETSPAEKKMLKESACRRLYVRFFDVDYGWSANDGIAPVGRLHNKEKFPAGIEIVPVIYITTTALSFIDSDEKRQKYVKLTVEKINRMGERNGIKKINEYQLDCDWTEKLRDDYFKLVDAFKKTVSPSQVSVTLRLYQYKYRKKSGIPPANRVMLMYYNMGEMYQAKDRNYILDNKAGLSYIKGVEKYPLPMDFALPLYYQGRSFTVWNDTLFNGLLNPQQLQEAKHIKHLQRKGRRTYVIHNSHFSGSDRIERGYYKAGKKIIVSDEFSRADLQEAVKILSACVNTPNYHVVFYHLDETFIQKYKAHELEEMVAALN